MKAALNLFMDALAWISYATLALALIFWIRGRK